MASGSEAYGGINAGRQSRAGKAGKGKPSKAKQRKAPESLKQANDRRAKSGDPF